MNTKQIVRRKEKGHCAQCGTMTHRWDKKWQWYICANHDSMEVARSIAYHVMYPNAD